MGRKKRSSATKQETAGPSSNGIEVRPVRPNKWFLAATILLQAGWLVFLGVLALTG